MYLLIYYLFLTETVVPATDKPQGQSITLPASNGGLITGTCCLFCQLLPSPRIGK